MFSIEKKYVFELVKLANERLTKGYLIFRIFPLTVLSKGSLMHHLYTYWTCVYCLDVNVCLSIFKNAVEQFFVCFFGKCCCFTEVKGLSFYNPVVKNVISDSMMSKLTLSFAKQVPDYQFLYLISI